MAAVLWVLGLLAAVLLFVTQGRHARAALVAYRRLVRCGEQIPGPPTFPLLGNALDVGIDPKDILIKGFQFWKVYGPTFRLWAGPLHLAVILIDARDVQILLTSSRNIKKPFNYNFLHSWLGQGLLTATGRRWYNHRKIITPTFHFRILEQFIETFNKQGDIFISLLKEREEQKSFDICPPVSLLTQDIICETAMGAEVHAQTDGYKSPYVKAVRRMCEIVMKRSSRPWLHPDFIYRLSPLRREEKRSLNIIHGVTNKMITERRERLRHGQEETHESMDLGMKKRLAFLDLLLTSEDGQTLSNAEIREEVDTFMFEGHDTTASAISFCLMEMSRRPDIQEKVFNELKEVSSGNKYLFLDMEGLNKLKYLEQVIKETLRFYPSVPIYGREITEELQLASLPVTLPPGTMVVVAAALLHRHPEYYPEPDTFNPDNFSSDAASKRHSFSYLPFSAGPRNCIGQKYAMLEMKTILAKVIWNFSLLADPIFELKVVPEITLKSLHGVKLSPIRRSHRNDAVLDKLEEKK